MRRSVSWVAVVSMALGGALAFGSSTSAAAPSAARPAAASPVAAEACDPAGGTATTYPISGYYMYPRIRPCAWNDELNRVKNLGGDTVVQFAPQFTPRGIDARGRLLRFHKPKTPIPGPDPAFAACVEGGKTCAQAADAALRAASPGSSVVERFAYATSDSFSDRIMTCPKWDKKISVKVTESDGFTHTRQYWRLLLPRANHSQTGCPTGAQKYDLVLVAGEEQNSFGTLLSEASELGMKVYAPMPAFPSSDGGNLDVDRKHQPIFTAFDRRILSDYAQRYANQSSFAGVYQTREYLLNPGNQPYLDAYRAQHADVHRLLPGRKIMASPYWSARRYLKPTGPGLNQAVTTPADITAATTAIFQTGVDIVAPQDGRGSATAGLFWPYEKNTPVDPRLKPKVGDRKYGDAFIAPSIDLFKAAAAGRDKVAGTGQKVELWANVEAFEPPPPAACGSGVGLTDKKRLDQALTHLGGQVSKVISFQWDPLFTCADGGRPALADAVKADHDRPVISTAFSFTSGQKSGLTSYGYHFPNATVTISWTGTDGKAETTSIPVAGNGWYDPKIGQRDPRLPDTMQAIWVPFDFGAVAAKTYVHVEITSGGKKAHHRFSIPR